jgi:RNA polymerase sigma factor (sigma-70 family)
MGNRQAGAVVEHLCQLIDTQRLRDLTDGQLLQRFVAARDEAAFTALMQRHGRLVLGVCRHLLHHAHDAEDAFQGTFLVLARKAASIRKRQSVGSWLYGVAHRVAMRAKKNAAKRLEREKQVSRPAEVHPPGEVAWRELQRLLDEELNRLPDRYRAPFVLCCLEGRTRPEAAQELGWKEGTVSSRLAQARKLLQARLARRGVSLSAVLCGTALAARGTAAALVAGAGKAAAPFAAGKAPAAGLVSAQAIALAEGSLRAGRLKLAAALLLLVTLAGGAAGMALYPRRTEDPPNIRPAEQRLVADRREEKPQPRRAPRKADPLQDQERQGDAVTGQVLDPTGRPLAGADVTLVSTFSPQQAGVRESAARDRRKVLASGRADAQGRFRLLLPRKALAQYGGLALLTSGRGLGPAWKTIGNPGPQQIQLRTEAGQELCGRLVDSQGRAAPSVQVQVTGFNKLNPRDKNAPQDYNLRFAAPPGSLSSWPAPATTDEQGNFALRGLPPDCEVYLRVDDPRFGPQWLIASTGHTARETPRTFALTPRRLLEGTVTCQDTGKPLAGTQLLITTQWQRSGLLTSRVEAQTDGQGRFRISPFPGERLVIFAHPPDRAPYMVMMCLLPWPRGELRQELHLALPRGVLVQGKVTERASGQPVAGAEVGFQARFTNPGLRRKVQGESVAFWKHNVRCGPDGSFRVVVLPGPGHLVVKGPTPDYLHEEISAGELTMGQPGGKPMFPDGLVAVNYPPTAGPQQVAVRLRRGVTISGRVVGEDGRPVRSALVLCPHYLPESTEFRGDLLRVGNGRFQVPGCDPDKGTTVLILDTGTRQGAVATLPAPPRGKKGGPEPVVRLAAIGRAKVRFIDQHGQPWDQPPVELHLLLRPGATTVEDLRKKIPAQVTFSAGAVFASVPAPTKPRGTVMFYNLIPGATYLILDRNTRQARTTFTLQPGQQLELPDIPIARPEKKTLGR